MAPFNKEQQQQKTFPFSSEHTVVIYYFYNQNEVFQKKDPLLSKIQIIGTHDLLCIYFSFKI